MIAKIAVSAATFAIDKPYSYAIPETMMLQPGLRVMVPFGRSNRHTEGVVLAVEDAAAEGLKQVAAVLKDVRDIQKETVPKEVTDGGIRVVLEGEVADFGG